MEQKEAFKRLGLSVGASKKEIRSAYAKLCKKYHPEDSSDEFVQLNEAYQVALRGVNEPGQENAAENTPIQFKSNAVRIENKEMVLEELLIRRKNRVSDWLKAYQSVMDKWEYQGLIIPSHALPEHITYIRENPVETEEEKAQIESLFQEENWKEISGDEELIDYVMENVHIQIPPRRMVMRLYETYASSRLWTEGGKKREFVEYLMRLLSFYRRIPEYNCYQPCEFPTADISKITVQNAEFWQYFLMTGYDSRGGEEISPLRRFIHRIYQPSAEWRKQFCRYQEEKEYCVPSLDIPLGDGRVATLKFHMHYVNYLLDGREIISPVFSFSELCNYSEMLKKPEYFFFLLGMTAIAETEKGTAVSEIEKRLYGLPLYKVTIPDIAQYIVENCCMEQALQGEMEKVFAFLYDETERFCFRIKMKMRSMEVCRLTENGWKKFELLSGEGKVYKKAETKQEKQILAYQKLQRLRQPKPVEIKRFSLEGMSHREKSHQIVEALRFSGKERRRANYDDDTPYVPGFPWGRDELTESVYTFFAKDGGYMTNDYVVLHLGNQKRPYFYKLITVSMNIFGYNLSHEFEQQFRDRKNRLMKMVPENTLIVGKIGWGGEEAPVPIAVGEDGMLYSCREEEVQQADCLSELLNIMFDFTDVTEISVFEGRITVSRLDGKVEYCYTRKDYEEYQKSKELTLANQFSNFWG